MIIQTWDSNIANVITCIKEFVEETNYPIEFNQQNTLNTLWAMYQDPETEIIVDYTDNGECTGFVIVQKTNEFHTEYFGYVSKFYVRKQYRQTRASYRLAQEMVDWFDEHCTVAFATDTANIHNRDSFSKLLTKFGFSPNQTGTLIRQ